MFEKTKQNRSMKKKHIWTLIIILISIYSCKKDITANFTTTNSKKLNISELQESLGKIGNEYAVNSNETNAINRGLKWLKSYSLELKDGRNILSIPFSRNIDDYLNGMQRRLVAYKDSLGNIQKAIMVVQPDEEYLKLNNGKVTLKTFTGKISFYTASNTFSRGYVLENGKIIGQLNVVKSSKTDIEEDPKKTQGWDQDCEWKKVGYYVEAGVLNVLYAKFCMWKYTEEYLPPEQTISTIAPEPPSGVGYTWEQEETEVVNVTDSLENFPCAKSLLTSISSLKDSISGLINTTFNTNTDFNIRFIPENFGANSNEDGAFNVTSIKPKNGYNHNAGIIFNSTISINEDIMKYASKEYILVTMYHELLHAYIALEKVRLSPTEFATKYPSINAAFVFGPGGAFDFTKPIFVKGHGVMGEYFINGLINAVKSYNPSLSDSTATALAVSGMFNQSTNLKLLNQNERDTRKGLYVGTKCP